MHGARSTRTSIQCMMCCATSTAGGCVGRAGKGPVADLRAPHGGKEARGAALEWDGVGEALAATHWRGYRTGSG